MPDHLGKSAMQKRRAFKDLQQKALEHPWLAKSHKKLFMLDFPKDRLRFSLSLNK